MATLLSHNLLCQFPMESVRPDMRDVVPRTASRQLRDLDSETAGGDLSWHRLDITSTN